VLTVIVAKMLGRDYSAPRALLLAGFVMLLENPKILVFDPSFQLSFLATLALIYVVPIVEKFLKFIPDNLTLRTTIATTLSTQLTVLPLLVYSMGNISLVSLPANVLVLLIIPYTMLLGFLATTISYISGVLALPLAYLAHLLLAWIIFISSFFGNMKFASLTVPVMPFWLVLIAYLALFGVIAYLSRERL
jgi:competence protein ComEC